MKIRIQDNSIRLRLTLREVEAFAKEGRIERITQVVGPAGLGACFRYALRFEASAVETTVRIDGPSIEVVLSATDRDALLREDEEGVYVRREWIAPDGAAHRFMVFVEKDRPGSTCVKKDQWIYDAPAQGPVETRPIPKKSAG